MKNITKRTLTVLLMAIMLFVSVVPFIAEETEAASSYLRIYGKNRYETAMRVAKNVKKAQGVSKFDTVILASGTSFPDALSGSYLSGVTGAPILLINENRYADSVISYVKSNLKRGGKIYLLGGNAAVPESIEYKPILGFSRKATEYMRRNTAASCNKDAWYAPEQIIRIPLVQVPPDIQFFW